MKFLFVLLSVVASQQLRYGAKRTRSFGPLDTLTRLMHSYKGLPDFDDLASDEKREVYIYEQTIVVRDAGPDNKVRRCQVIEVYREIDAAKAQRELEIRFKFKVQKVNMKRMMSLLGDCDSVAEWDADVKKPVAEPDVTLSDLLAMGIIPGTKWCGVGDIANGYHDLGQFRDVDRCCRAHDFCPIKILTTDTRYNLTNFSHYAKSHCSCNKAFHDCLKKDDGRLATKLEILYFNVASSQCIEGVPEDSGKEMKFVITLNQL